MGCWDVEGRVAHIVCGSWVFFLGLLWAGFENTLAHEHSATSQNILAKVTFSLERDITRVLLYQSEFQFSKLKSLSD